MSNDEPDDYDDCTTLVPNPEHRFHDPGDYTEITVTAYLRMGPDGTLTLAEFNTEDRMDVEHYSEKHGHLHVVDSLSSDDAESLCYKIGDLQRQLLATQKGN
jgi:hypothetical protein